MPYRVVLWGAGIVGAHAIDGIDLHPDLELVGVWVSSAAKVGQDAGDLAKLGRKLGVIATSDEGALLALKPDCIISCAASDSRATEAIATYERFLRAGINVVATGPAGATFPGQGGVAASLSRTALAAGKSVWVNGIDPGFSNDSLPMLLSGLSKRIDKVHVTEIFNYNTYSQLDSLRSMGFGLPANFTPGLAHPGALIPSFGPAVRQIAAGLGVELDSLEQHVERGFAAKSISTPVMEIAVGTQDAVRFDVTGMKDGKPVVVIEHVTRMSDEAAPSWPQPGGLGCYRVAITGEPNFNLELQMNDGRDDLNNAACMATAMRVVNAVPAVVAARPGHLSIYDLPLVTGRYQGR
jgi:4-hydroxy-tetrahydrodipicolinate reductase